MYDVPSFLLKAVYRYMGGGGGQAQQINQAPVATPAPPVTQNSAEVVQATQDTMRQDMLKKSVKKTIFAGDTGGFTPNMAATNPYAAKPMATPGKGGM
jgi:enolase